MLRRRSPQRGGWGGGGGGGLSGRSSLAEKGREAGRSQTHIPHVYLLNGHGQAIRSPPGLPGRREEAPLCLLGRHSQAPLSAELGQGLPADGSPECRRGSHGAHR